MVGIEIKIFYAFSIAECNCDIHSGVTSNCPQSLGPLICRRRRFENQGYATIDAEKRRMGA